MPISDRRCRFTREPRREDYRRAAAMLGEAAELAGSSASGSPSSSRRPRAFAPASTPRWPWSSVRLRERRRLPRPVPLLHRAEQVRGPGLSIPRQPRLGAGLRPRAVPRELAGDSDRILPGEGDFQIGPILDHLGRIGYDGYVSLEVLNPQLWQVPADRVADLGYQAVCRVLGTWNRIRPATLGRSLSVSTVVTMRPAAIVFREEQYFDWRVYALIAALELVAGYCLVWLTRHWDPVDGPAGAPVVHRILSRSAHRPGPAPGDGGLPAAHDHRGHADRSPRLVRLGADLSPRGRDHRHPAVQRRQYRPIIDYGGWGIRTGRDGERVLNARGNRGVRLELADGSRLLIGSHAVKNLPRPSNAPVAPTWSEPGR